MMPYLEFITLWQLFQIFQCVISLWIAVIIFGQRGTGRWLILVSSALQFGVYIGVWHVPRFASELRHLMGLQMISMTMGTCTSTFLLGILLYLSGQRSNAKRIADLEAIIREHDLADEARVKSA